MPLQTDGDTEGYVNIQQSPCTPLLLPDLSLQRPQPGWCHDPYVPQPKPVAITTAAEFPSNPCLQSHGLLKVEAPGRTEQVVPKHPTPSQGAGQAKAFWHAQ